MTYEPIQAFYDEQFGTPVTPEQTALKVVLVEIIGKWEVYRENNPVGKSSSTPTAFKRGKATEFKVGDRVKIIRAMPGGTGCNDETGIIISHEPNTSNHGVRRGHDYPNIRLDSRPIEVWSVGPEAILELIEPASEENYWYDPKYPKKDYRCFLPLGSTWNKTLIAGLISRKSDSKTIWVCLEDEGYKFNDGMSQLEGLLSSVKSGHLKEVF